MDRLPLTSPQFATTPQRNEFNELFLSYLHHDFEQEHNDSDAEQYVDEVAHRFVDRWHTFPCSADPWYEAEGSLFAILWHYVTQIPSEHPYTIKLMILLLHIRKIRGPSNDQIPDGIHGRGYWHTLWGLGSGAWYHFERVGPAYPPRKDEWAAWFTRRAWPDPGEPSPESWTRMNTFMAKFATAAGQDFHGMVHLMGLDALIDALEEDIDSEKMNDLLPSAAGWILEAGPIIRTWRTTSGLPLDSDWIFGFSRGKLNQGQNIFCHER